MRDYFSCADTAKLIRAALKRAFPAVKFSVRSSTYAGGASIDVSWDDGPSAAQVQPIAGAFAGADFDGMIDLKTHREHFLMPDGSVALADAQGTEQSRGSIPAEHHFKPHPEARRVSFGADYVFCTRRITPAFMAAFRAAWRALPEIERSALLNRTGAWHLARHVTSWRVDDELADFGHDAEDVFKCMARATPATAQLGAKP